MRLQFLLLASLFVYASSLQNGIAKTPPMGWMSWAKFYCEIDCNKYPNACINADLYQGQADRMVSDGYLAAGYTGVHIDDCWLEYDRSSDGKLVPNRTRFPSGMDGLAKYMHDRGLQLAIYEDVGTKTCAGYPGSWQHETIDAQTFAAWGIDYLKYDGCNLDYHQFNVGFPAMRDALASAGRPIVYSIEWDAQYIPKDQWGNINYSFIAQVSNLNRDYYDVSKSWDSIANIIDHFVANQDRFIAIQGPGYWNDPDMIVVGNSDITLDQARVQMSIWSSWSAPLIMSNDLRAMPPGHAEILLNKYVIAVDQDPLGIMARMVNVTGNCNVRPYCQMTFVKPMTPMIKNGTYSYAVAIVNRDTTAHPVSFVLSNLGLTNPSGYNVMDLWAGKIVGTYKPSDTYTANVNGTGVHFIKATALQ